MWRTIGHEKAVRHLSRSLDQGRLSHAYLFTGPPRVGKMSLAMDLARALNCLGHDRPCDDCVQCDRIARALHADVRVVEVESGPNRTGGSRTAIGIDQVRDVQREASLKPYEGRYRVFVFDGAEHVTAEAANSLLKTLEEPPDQVRHRPARPRCRGAATDRRLALPAAGAPPRGVGAHRRRAEVPLLLR